MWHTDLTFGHYSILQSDFRMHISVNRSPTFGLRDIAFLEIFMENNKIEQYALSSVNFSHGEYWKTAPYLQLILTEDNTLPPTVFLQSLKYTAILTYVRGDCWKVSKKKIAVILKSVRKHQESTGAPACKSLSTKNTPDNILLHFR